MTISEREQRHRARLQKISSEPAQLTPSQIEKERLRKEKWLRRHSNKTQVEYVLPIESETCVQQNTKEISPIAQTTPDPYTVLTNICTAHGMMTIAEVDALIGIVPELRFGALAVVIGAACGTATIALLMARSDIQVVSVDINDAVTERFHARELGFSERLVQIRDSSYTMQWNGPQVDLLFVDGCHTYPCVKNDIAAWLPRMKPDGIICFHDYGVDNGMWLDVKHAVDEDMVGYKQLYHVGCSIAFSLGDPL